MPKRLDFFADTSLPKRPVPLGCWPLIVTTQQNRSVHRHQAEECEQALRIDCFIIAPSFLLDRQSELDRRHQSAFLKKRFCIHHVPPARAADKKIQPT